MKKIIEIVAKEDINHAQYKEVRLFTKAMHYAVPDYNSCDTSITVVDDTGDERIIYGKFLHDNFDIVYGD